MKKTPILLSLTILFMILLSLVILIKPEKKKPSIDNIEQSALQKPDGTIKEEDKPPISDQKNLEKPLDSGDDSPKIEPEKDRGPKFLVTMKPESVLNIEYVSTNDKLVFTKDKSNWIVGDGSYNRINYEKIDNILNKLFSLKSLETVSFTYEEDKEWGLNENSETISIKTADEILTIRIGSLNNSKSGYYVKIDELDEVYLVSNAFDQSLKISLDNIRIRELPEIDVNQISELTLQKEATIKIVPFERSDMFTADSFNYMLTEPYLYSVPVSNQRLTGVLETMKESLKIADFIDWGTPEDYGLQKEGSHLTIREKSGKVFDMLIGNDAGVEKIYGKMAGEDQIFTINKQDLPFLEIKAFELIDLHPQLIELNTIDAISLTTDELPVIATIEKKVDGNRYSINGMETEENIFKEFYNTLLSLKIEGEVHHSISDDTAELTISYKLYDGGSHWAHLFFFPYDNNNYAIARENEEPLFTISRSQVKEVLRMVIKTVDEAMGF